MTQHPEEGTLHAYIDGELAPAESAALEQHVGECAACAAALAEARGLVAASSRVITALDAAPAAATPSVVSSVAPPSVRARGEQRSPIFRPKYARAAALLLLVGGTAVVLDRSGSFARGKSPAAELPVVDAPARRDISPAALAEAEVAAASVAAAGAAKAPAPSIGAGGGTTDNTRRDADAPRRFSEARTADSASRTRLAERRARVPEPARAVAPPTVIAGEDAAQAVPSAQALAAVSPPPVPPAIALEEVIASAAPASSSAVSRYRTKGGVVLTLTEEPLRTSPGQELQPAQPSTPQPVQRKTAAPAVAAAAAAASTGNTYRWSSVEQGKIFTLSGPLTVAELEALSRQLGELERVP